MCASRRAPFETAFESSSTGLAVDQENDPWRSGDERDDGTSLRPGAVPDNHSSGESGGAHSGSVAARSLAALGVVYGDIGTSPIYAMRESLHGVHGVAATTGNVRGLLSLIFWALLIIISVKYLKFVMRADNDGEGGMIALTALVTPRRRGDADITRSS